jgi:hypothetical protein
MIPAKVTDPAALARLAELLAPAFARMGANQKAGRADTRPATADARILAPAVTTRGTADVRPRPAKARISRPPRAA